MIVANQIAIVKQPMSIATSSMSYMKLVTGDVLYGVVDTTSYNSFIATHIYWGNSLNGLAGTNQPRLTIPLSNLILSPKGQMPIQLVDGYKWVLVSMPNPKITSGDIDSGFFKFNAPFATQTNQPQTLDDMVNGITKPNYNFNTGKIIYGNLGLVTRGVYDLGNGTLSSNNSGISEYVLTKNYPNVNGQSYNVLNAGTYFIPTNYLQLIAPPIIKNISIPPSTSNPPLTRDSKSFDGVFNEINNFIYS